MEEGWPFHSILLEKLHTHGQKKKTSTPRPNPTPYIKIISKWIMNLNISVTFLKSQNYRNGKQMSGCQGLKKGGGWEGSGCDYNRATRRGHLGDVVCLDCIMSISWLWWCTTVSLDVTIWGRWVESTWNRSIIFLGNNMLLIYYESTIISKWKNLI